MLVILQSLSKLKKEEGLTTKTLIVTVDSTVAAATVEMVIAL